MAEHKRLADLYPPGLSWPRPPRMRRVHLPRCVACNEEGQYRNTDDYGGSHGPFCYRHAAEDLERLEAAALENIRRRR